jgi:short-subunit dehydrogenase
MSYFTGKTIWITGASSGIGEALTRLLAKEGAKLVLSSRRETELRRVQHASGLSDDHCMILPLDLEHLDAVETLVKSVENRFGGIDILINNGGISQRSFAKDTPAEIDRRLMEVNFLGPVALTKAVLPGMIIRKKGQIVVISSVSGKFGFYLRSTYAATKHALHGFFESLRMEVYKDQVKVLLVCPGRISTNIGVNALTGEDKQYKEVDSYHAIGMAAEECAMQILEATKEMKEEVIIGSSLERRAIFIKRFFPELFSRMIRKQKIG